MTTSRARIVVPQFPSIVLNATCWTLGFTETSAKWDLKTELLVRLIRSLLSSPRPMTISAQQRNSLKDPGVSGPMWISKVTLAAPPESSALDTLCAAIDALKPSPNAQYTVPAVCPVEAEWTGHRANTARKAPRPHLPEPEQYAKLMAEVTSDVTVLYFHGGALYLMDPATHRTVCAALAKKTGGRCLSVRYRLAPRYPFPAALLDCFLAYLGLLAPPPGALHAPVPAKHIVFAGDSAGGTMSFALLQLLLHLRQTSSTQTPTVRFHGQDVPIEIPAGVACQSPWLDVTLSSPSFQSNRKFDYLPSPRDVRSFPTCALWPTHPPRGDLYCELAMLAHPLVSPLGARDWRGACPVFVACGEEVLADEARVVARRIARQGQGGGGVRWMQFEAMPHCFAMIFVGGRESRRALGEWAAFIAKVVKGETVETGGSWFEARTMREEPVDVKGLAEELPDGEVEKRMKEAARRREERKVYTDERLAIAKL